MRLTFYYNARALRLTVDAQGAVFKQARFPVGAPRQARPMAL